MTTINLAPIQDLKALNKAIKSIATRASKLENDIWIAALSCAWHIKQDNQVTPLNNLIEALGKGIRTNAVKAYAETFMAVKWDEKSKKFKYDGSKATDMPGCARKSPFEFKPEAEYKPINLPAALARLVKQAEAHAEKGDPRDLIPSDMLIALRSLVPVPAE